MTIWQIFFLSIVMTLTSVSSGMCDIIVTPENIESGDLLTITATNGTPLDEKTPTKVECGGVSMTTTYEKKSNESAKVMFNAPELESNVICTIKIGEIVKVIQVRARYPYIKEAVLWKKQGLSDAAILGHISKMATQELNDKGVSPSVFDGVPIRGSGVEQLKQVNFSEDFITKLEGQPQWVTLGMAAIFLPDGGKVTTAPLLRIMLEPKSYYKPRYKFGHLFSNEFSSVLRQKFDVNIGYTVISIKTDSENTNFLLAGFSYEINPSALLNFGAAIPTGSVKDKSVTSYVGVTVDQNFLKAIGLME